jgi:hypothetical protein
MFACLPASLSSEQLQSMLQVRGADAGGCSDAEGHSGAGTWPGRRIAAGAAWRQVSQRAGNSSVLCSHGCCDCCRHGRHRCAPRVHPNLLAGTRASFTPAMSMASGSTRASTARCTEGSGCTASGMGEKDSAAQPWPAWPASVCSNVGPDDAMTPLDIGGTGVGRSSTRSRF